MSHIEAALPPRGRPRLQQCLTPGQLAHSAILSSQTPSSKGGKSMGAWPCWLAVLVSGANLGVALGLSFNGPGPAPAANWSNDSELLLGSPWAAQLGWNRTLPMCGADRKSDQSKVDTATNAIWMEACYCSRLAADTPVSYVQMETVRGLNCSQHHRLFNLSASWSNIICNQHDQVIALCLSFRNLNGRLPGEWGALSQLRFLDMPFNGLQGSLPSQWGQLKRVTHLTLTSNSLSGTLPAEWRGMENLKSLYIGNNSFVGSLPREWGQLKHLTDLELAVNKLSGSLPAEWRGMEVLSMLYLFQNRLVGSLPTEWGQLKQLTFLSMGSNFLSGSLPLNWSNMTNLTALSLWNNMLEGPLPSEWGKLKRLEVVEMSSNTLSGTLPGEWSGMHNLATLSLGNNSLVGSLPREWGHLKRLHALSLGHNFLSGTLSVEWSGLENVTTLNVWTNGLVGSLPREWGQLKSLANLFLARNNLNGSLPAEWGALGNLTVLSVWSNRLVGALPPDWAKLGKLVGLSVRNNHLSGTVPLREWSRMANFKVLDASFNRLSGSLPSDVLFPAVTLLADNQLSGSLPNNMTGARLLNLSSNSFSGALPDPLTAPQLEALYIGGNPGLQKPVPDCWLYHRSCLPALKLLSDGGLLRESASTYSWRRRNCRDELAFQWGGLQNISSGLKQLFQLGDDVPVFNVTYYFGEKINVDDQDINALCSNENVPQVLGGLWGAFMVLVLGGYALRKRVIPCWRAFMNSSWGPGGSVLTNVAAALFASIYWYDWVTDVMVIQEVWPAWTGGLLLALALLNYVVSGWVMVWHAWRLAAFEDSRPPSELLSVKVMLWTIGWLLITALVPLLDTVVLLLYLLQDMYIPFIQIRSLDIDGFMHMRDVVKALATALPTAVLTSAVYAMGNSPDVRLVYTEGVFVASLVGSLLLLLWAWYSSLFECEVEGIGIWEHFRMVFTGETLPPDPNLSVTPRSAASRHQDPIKSQRNAPLVTKLSFPTTAPEVQLERFYTATSWPTPELDYESCDKEDRPHASAARGLDQVGAGGPPPHAGLKAAELEVDDPGKAVAEGARSGKAAVLKPKAIVYKTKDLALKALNSVVRLAVMRGPVAAVVLLDYFKDFEE
eukprot:jgi/Botrbrau1/11582/Bobra.247_1s0003.1